MKSKLTLVAAMTLACAAVRLAAMPTEEETRKAEPVVKKLLAQERAALNSGKMTRSEVAAAAMKLADKAESDAEKLLLMKGACDFYVHAGEFDKAIETLQAMMMKIPDIPYATIVSILEYSLRGVSRNSAKDLWAFLDETKSRLRNTDTTHGKKAQSETNIQKFYRLFPGWEICKDAQEKEKLGFELAYRGQFNVAVLHPVSKEIPAVVSHTLKLSGKNPCLFLKVSSCDYSGEADWVLSVRVNGKEILPKRLVVKSPISEPWEDIAVPLFAWRGQEVKVEVVVTANGWFCEFAYFKRLEIAEGSGRENLIPEATETVGGYTWSYRVQNGEATIISEKDGKDSCAVSPNPVGSIVIPATLGGAKVTSIGRGALACCQELESVTIPQGVKRIGRVAFFECKKLKSVEIPSSVTEIDWCAFYRCNALASVAIPSDSELKTLENGAFAECFELKSIEIPDGVTRIARHAFLGCFNIKSLTIPATASNIGGEAFRFCANLSSVTMLGEKPDTSVPPVNRSRTSDNIFLDCGKLKEIHVPANAKSWAGMKEWHGIPLVFDAEDIGRQAQTEGVRGRLLSRRGRLRNIRAESAAEQLQATVDGYTWSYRVNNGEATIVAEKDGKRSCAVSPAPTGSIAIPTALNGVKVTAIGEHAFFGCYGLSSVTIPSGVKRICNGAFYYCAGIKAFKIPSSVTDIEATAFTACTGVQSFSVDSNNPSYSSRNGLLCSKDGSMLLAGVNGNVTIPAGVVTIGRQSFLSRGLQMAVVIPSSVKCIEERAFAYCPKLTSVMISSKTLDIGPGAFKECGALASVAMPSNMTGGKIMEGAFSGCRSLKSMTIPEGVTEIGVGAFGGCRELDSVTIPASVTNIEWLAFSGCEALTQINIAEGNQWFSLVDGVLCTKDQTELVMCPNGLSSVTIQPSVKNIRGDAFRGCAKLTAVTVPASVESCSCAFTYCGALKQINVDVQNQKYASVDGVVYTKDLEELVMAPGGLKSVPILAGVKRITSGAFKGCSTLTSVTIPAGVDRILPWTFEGCSSLESVTILGNVTYIGHQAFWACRELTSFTMRGERPEAPNDIFMGCGKLKAIHVPANAKSWAGMKEWFGIPLVFDAKAAESRQEQSRYMIVDLDKSGIDAVSYLDDVPNGGWSDEYKTKKIAFRRIDPGSFEYMPGRSFKITKPFYIGVFEVTQKQYEMVMKVNPSTAKGKGDMCPVEMVSYLDIRGSDKGLNWPKDNKVDDDSYLGKLRKRIGLEFDLPTEVQWEYACRAGTKGTFNVDGVEMVKLGKCADNGGGYANVGSFLPNAWGLYDMHGNVWEWCIDRGTDGEFRTFYFFGWGPEPKETETDPKGPTVGSSRLFRGGSDAHPAERCSSSSRARFDDPGYRGDVGIRLVCPADGHPMKLSTDDKLRKLKADNGNERSKGKATTVSSGKEIVDGIEWTYNIIGGEAQVDYASSSNATGAISIPSTLGGCQVTSIGRNEFRSGFGWRVFEKFCNKMTSVAIPSGVVNIGDSAFSGCSNLVSVTIPASVTNIARCAFSRCGSLTSFAVDAGNTKYSSRNGLLCSKDGSALIAGVNGNVTIPPSVKDIGDYAFQGRIGLKSMMIPSSVTSVGIFAFSDCCGLETVVIPASMKKIGWYAFSGCSGLMSFSVDPGNPSYSARGGMLCSKDGSTLIAGVNGDVTIPASVNKIDRHAFDRCSGLTSVVIPDSVKSIGECAFRWCSGLTSVTIPSSVTDIGFYAFFGCKKLGTVMIPSSVTKIGRGLFSGCDKLMSFSVDPANSSYSSRNGMLCTKDGATLISGVNGDVAIPSCVRNIADNAFSDCNGLTSVTIPSSVTNIGYQAFDKCEELTSVEIPSSVKSIGERAFTMCYKIKSVTIPEGVTSIGKYAFAWCEAIESVTIPRGVTIINECAFADCSGLKSVSIPTSVTSIGDNAFFNCSGLTSMTIPSSVKSIGIGAFYDCSALKTVVVPSSVTSIGRKAFDKTQFYDDMPDGVVILGGGVLYGYKGECPSSVTIPSNVTNIGENAFRGSSRLEVLTIPSTVTDIDGRAFVDCPNLKSVRVVKDGKIETMSFDDFFKPWKNVVAQRLKKCDFLLNKDFKKSAKYYLCLFSASWCPPCRAEMPRIAKTYAETLKDDPNIELIHFSWDQNDEKALAWAKEHDVKFPVVKPKGGNPLDLHTRGIPHLFIVKADGTLIEEGHPMKLFTDEKLRKLKVATP